MIRRHRLHSAAHIPSRRSTRRAKVTSYQLAPQHTFLVRFTVAAPLWNDPERRVERRIHVLAASAREARKRAPADSVILSAGRARA